MKYFLRMLVPRDIPRGRGEQRNVLECVTSYDWKQDACPDGNFRKSFSAHPRRVCTHWIKRRAARGFRARALSLSLLSLFLSLSLSLSLYLRFSRVRSAAYNPNDPHDLWPGLAARNDPGCICVIATTDHHLSLPAQVWITAALKHDGCATTWQGIARLI